MLVFRAHDEIVFSIVVAIQHLSASDEHMDGKKMVAIFVPDGEAITLFDPTTKEASEVWPEASTLLVEEKTSLRPER